MAEPTLFLGDVALVDLFSFGRYGSSAFPWLCAMALMVCALRKERIS